jgi:hypothetical protein
MFRHPRFRHQGFDGATQNLTRDDNRLKNDSFDTPTDTAVTGAGIETAAA